MSAAASSGYSEFLTFDYTVQSGDYDADGFSIAAGALTLGRVVDRGARAANLNLGRHAISSAAGYRVNNAPPSFGSATVANRKFDTDTPIAPLVLPEATGEGTLSYHAHALDPAAGPDLDLRDPHHRRHPDRGHGGAHLYLEGDRLRRRNGDADVHHRRGGDTELRFGGGACASL